MKTRVWWMALALARAAPAAVTDELLAKANAGDLVAQAEAAEQGDAGAQYLLGQRYATGDGVAKNTVNAVKWLKLSAEQGNGEAQLQLGSLYLGGKGIPKDSTESAKWFQLAANQGRAEAQVQVSRMHLAGAGVPKDDVTAYQWATLAARQHDPSATKILTFLRQRMTAEQIREAEALADESLKGKIEESGATGVPLVAPPLEPEDVTPAE